MLVVLVAIVAVLLSVPHARGMLLVGRRMPGSSSSTAVSVTAHPIAHPMVPVRIGVWHRMVSCDVAAIAALRVVPRVVHGVTLVVLQVSIASLYVRRTATDRCLKHLQHVLELVLCE